MDRSHDIAWAAGVFEGEGSITVRRHRGYGRIGVRFTMSMTDLDVMERFHAIVGRGTLTGPAWHSGSTKPQWRFYAGKPGDVAAIAWMFRPYLGERRRQRLKDALREYRTQPAKRNYFRDRTHCARGHELTEANILRYPSNPVRRCRRCEHDRRGYAGAPIGNQLRLVAQADLERIDY